VESIPNRRHHVDDDTLGCFAMNPTAQHARDIAKHFSVCPYCRAKLKDLKQDITFVRQVYGGIPLSEPEAGERRMEPRTPLSTMTELVQKACRGTALIKDFSARGLGVRSSFPLQAGRQVQVRIGRRKALYRVQYCLRTPAGWRSGLLHASDVVHQPQRAETGPRQKAPA
jgi:hypothetical protein